MSITKNSKLNLILSLLMLLMLTACGGRSAETSFYVLNSGATTPAMALNDPDAQANMPKVQLRAVDMPKYLDRSAIVTRESNGVRLQLASFDSWAESLDSGTKRVISEVLTPLFFEKEVLLLPLDDESMGPWQIFIQVQRFDGTIGQDVVLDARWTVRDYRDNILLSGAFVDKVPAGLSYASLVQAQSDLLKKLAESMATPIISAVKED